MSVRCDSKISEGEAFVRCLKAAQISFAETVAEAAQMVSPGYLEIGGQQRLAKPTKKSLKVLFFKQWACDPKGNLYLLGQLG